MKEDFEDIFHEEEYSELVNRYEEMLKNNTKYFFDVIEFESIIDYYIDSNKANNALNAVKFASQQHPYSLNIQLKKAQVLVDKGHASQALQVIEQIERIESSNSDVYLLKGSTLNVMGRYSEAERAFDTAIIYSYDDKVDVIHTIAQSFEQIGRYKTALKYLHQAYKMDSKNIMLLYDIGYCYEKLGQINKSIEFYKQFLDKDPFAENAWYNLGVLYNKSDKYTNAIEAYEFALAINPEFSVAYFNLANAYSNNEDFHNAIISYKEYLKFDGKSVEILTFIGDCYESLK
jgi:predicted Zn-dependent protease